MISLFGGTGFIGSNFQKYSTYKSTPIERDSKVPISNNILYMISTTDNYNVFSNPQLDIETNLKTLVETLKNLKPGDTFNFISSWFVYGDTWRPAVEEDVCNPKGFYSITKRCAEQLIESYCKTFGIDYRILRLCNVYGPGDIKASEKKNALTYMIGKLKNNEPVHLYEGGLIFRDYMHIRDVIRAIDVTLKKATRDSITNIGYGESIYFGNLIKMAKKYLNSDSELLSIPIPQFHKTVQTKHFFMDTSKLQSYGFIPEISHEKGIYELSRL